MEPLEVSCLKKSSIDFLQRTRKKKVWLRKMQKFSFECSIHGINFVFGENRSKFVRILWLIFLLSSFSGFFYYSYVAYVKYYFAPDIAVRIRDRIAGDFPEPAVTICSTVLSTNNYLASPRRSFKAFFNHWQFNRSECELLAANSQWCHSTSDMKFFTNICSDSLKDMDTINALELSTEHAFKMSKEEFIMRELTQVFTHRGICYSANMQDFSDIFNEKEIHIDFKCYEIHLPKQFEWTVERGYFHKKANYPQRLKAEFGRNFEFNLSAETTFNTCDYPTMQVFLHLPSELPTRYSKNVPVSFGSNIAIRVAVKSQRTDDSLRSYTPDVRKCFFEGEKRLRFFKSYTKALCDLECVTNATLLACDCVNFWMPRNEATQICMYTQLSCAYDIFPSMTDDDRAKCDCYPPCNDIKYEIESYPIGSAYESPIKEGQKLKFSR